MQFYNHERVPYVGLYWLNRAWLLLLDYARRKGIDLVVVGTLGKTNLRYALLGSTAERVVRDSPCSVLAIPPAA